MATLTQDLSPKSGVRIVETYYPKGFNVAKYDADSFASDGRWFETLAAAEAYAEKLETSHGR